MLHGETIAALATAPGRGGVAIVRVSGPDARAVARQLTGVTGAGGTFRLAAVRDGEGRLLDRALVLFFVAPHSYTGEDTVEFHCHGGVFASDRVLKAVLKAGARLARRGEFTLRAFLNGRLDLSAAEGVLELVEARSEGAADEALRRLDGGAERRFRPLYDRARELSAALEFALDVDEGELAADFLASRAEEARLLAADCRDELRLREAGRRMRLGALVVLAGPPNAGKSSLLNALIGQERAIVSDEPGTTRDAIEVTLQFGRWPVRLVDTAGLRTAAGKVESAGIRRAEELVAAADVVLALGEVAAPEAKVLRLHGKCDLGRGAGLNVSAVTGEGLSELRAAVASRLDALLGAPGEAAVTLSEAEGDSLLRAAAALEGLPEEPVLAAEAARQAAAALGELVGAVYSEELLDTLFSRFCVGK